MIPERAVIDQWLHAVVRQRAGELRLGVGLPPMIRLGGRLTPLQAEPLEPSDTLALMKFMTPKLCQRALASAGKSEFEFGFGNLARFQVSIIDERGQINMVLRNVAIADEASTG